MEDPTWLAITAELKRLSDGKKDAILLMMTWGEDDDENDREYPTLDWLNREEQICEVEDPEALLRHLQSLPDDTPIWTVPESCLGL
jgi:hypothetical protein